MNPTVVFGIWLGIPVLALIWANLNLWHARRFLKQLGQPAPKPWSASTAADGVANASTAAMKAFPRMTAISVAMPISSQHVGLNSSQYLRQTPLNREVMRIPDAGMSNLG